MIFPIKYYNTKGWASRQFVCIQLSLPQLRRWLPPFHTSAVRNWPKVTTLLKLHLFGSSPCFQLLLDLTKGAWRTAEWKMENSHCNIVVIALARASRLDVFEKWKYGDRIRRLENSHFHLVMLVPGQIFCVPRNMAAVILTLPLQKFIAEV